MNLATGLGGRLESYGLFCHERRSILLGSLGACLASFSSPPRCPNEPKIYVHGLKNSEARGVNHTARVMLGFYHSSCGQYMAQVYYMPHRSKAGVLCQKEFLQAHM